MPQAKTMTHLDLESHSSLKGVIIIAAFILLLMLFPTYSINLIAEFTQYAIDTFGLGFILFSTAMALLA